MAFAETTNPDFVNQFASTGVANPAELQRQAAAAWQRISKAPRKPVYYEPQWEDPGLHGSAKQVSLRRTNMASGKIRRARLTVPSYTALPPMPQAHGMSAGHVVLIAGVAAVIAGGVAWYLWKRKPAAPATHVGELETETEDACGFHMLGAE